MENAVDLGRPERTGPAEDSPKRSPSPLDRASLPSSAVASARVLLIEDEPGIVDFVRRGLQAEGFSVKAVSDGIEGERLALRDTFDAIVLDLMLPGRSGLEILASVQRARPNVPVIVLTARGGRGG